MKAPDRYKPENFGKVKISVSETLKSKKRRKARRLGGELDRLEVNECTKYYKDNESALKKTCQGKSTKEPITRNIFEKAQGKNNLGGVLRLIIFEYVLFVYA